MAEAAEKVFVASDDEIDEDDDERTLEGFCLTKAANILARATSNDEESREEESETTLLVMEHVVMKREELREEMRQLSQSEEMERANEQGQFPAELLKKIPIVKADIRDEIFGDFPELLVEQKGTKRFACGRGRGFTKFGKYTDADIKKRVEAQANGGFNYGKDQRNTGFQDWGNGHSAGSSSSSSIGSEDGVFQDSFREARGRGMTKVPSVYDTEIDSLFCPQANPKMSLGD